VELKYNIFHAWPGTIYKKLENMKIVDRYIFKSYISNFLVAVIGMMVLTIIADIFSFIDEIFKMGISPQNLFAFYFYQSPLYLVHIIPICCLISSVYLLGNLNKHNEMVALRTSGISIWRAMTPIFFATLLICIGVFIVNNTIVPPSTRMANKIRIEHLDIAKRGKEGIKEIKNVALFSSNNKIIYVSKMDASQNVLYNIIIQKNNLKNNLVSKVTADLASWQESTWIGKGIVIYSLDGDGKIIGTPTFESEGVLPITETPIDFINNQWQPEYMSYQQLKRYIDSFGKSSRNTLRRLHVDLYHKTALPFISLIMVLVSASFTLTTARGGALLGMAKGVVIALCYIPVMAIGVALGKNGLFPPIIGAWFGNLVFGALGIWLLEQRK
jgi:lipopolysaccharide export system permease protein